MHSRLTVAALLLPLAATACGSVAPPSAAPVVNKLDVARGASAQLSTDRREDFVRHERHAATVRFDRIEGPAIRYHITIGAEALPPPGD